MSAQSKSFNAVDGRFVRHGPHYRCDLHIEDLQRTCKVASERRSMNGDEGPQGFD
jgi:hypothetical protein